MTIYERVRAIQGAASKNTKKDVVNMEIQQSFAAHFADSVDYHDDTLVDGVSQRLIVARNKNVDTEKKIYAFPGETFNLGSMIDCFGSKWMVKSIDPNDEQYLRGTMELCNKQIFWQDESTLEIVSRWITMDKPYFSNLDENTATVVSTRMYKIYLPYDNDTCKLHVDKRLMLEIINDTPITYKVTSVDVSTGRYMYKGEIKGIICLYVEQDQYNPKTDSKELMICDYIPSQHNTDNPGTGITSSISYKGKNELKIGSSFKKFTPNFLDDEGNPMDIEAKWSVKYLEEFKDFVQTKVVNNELSIKILPNNVMEGAVIRIELSETDETNKSFIECKVVTLI